MKLPDCAIVQGCRPQHPCTCSRIRRIRIAIAARTGALGSPCAAALGGGGADPHSSGGTDWPRQEPEPGSHLVCPLVTCAPATAVSYWSYWRERACTQEAGHRLRGSSSFWGRSALPCTRAWWRGSPALALGPKVPTNLLRRSSNRRSVMAARQMPPDLPASKEIRLLLIRARIVSNACFARGRRILGLRWLRRRLFQRPAISHLRSAAQRPMTPS
jgi:hypothetical protein